MTDQIKEIIEMIEKKPLKDLNEVELRLQKVCTPNLSLEEKKACYAGFYAGYKFSKEQKGGIQQ